MMNFFFCGVETVVNTSKPYAKATRIADNPIPPLPKNQNQNFF